MMKKYSVLIAVIVVLVQCRSASAVLTLADGGHHIIDYTVNTLLKIDRDAPGMGTTVDLIEGGTIIAWVDAYEDSRFNMSGGRIDGSLDGWDNSRLTITGGEIGARVHARDNSRLDISGGWIESQVQIFDNVEATISGGDISGFVDAWHNSRLTISGGSITDHIAAVEGGLITLVGTDFAVDGTPVAYGDFVSDFGIIGSITGTLANDDALDIEFQLVGVGGDITFIPEPAMVLLLGLGGLGLLRRRRRHAQGRRAS